MITGVARMWKRLCGPFKEYGPGAGALYAIDRVMQALSPHLRLFVYELMVQPVSDQPLLPARLSKSLEVREIRRGDPDVVLMPARPEIKQSRFDQGARCLGAYRNGQLVGYMWFCPERYEEDEVRCTYLLSPAARSVFDFDLYIYPEHRMGLAFIGIWNGANEHLRRRGVDFTFSRVTRFNLASRRAHAHLGAKRIGMAVFLRAWTLEMMLATVRPFLWISWRAGKRVGLRLAPDPSLPRATGTESVRVES